MQVLFFAQLREDLGTASIVLEEPVESVAQLRLLLQAKGQKWQTLLSADRSLAAVNQTLCDDRQSLNEGDEVAFFPPVTGG